MIVVSLLLVILGWFGLFLMSWLLIVIGLLVKFMIFRSCLLSFFVIVAIAVGILFLFGLVSVVGLVLWDVLMLILICYLFVVL